MLATGLRRGEALGLHWRDVHLDARMLRVRWTLTRTSRPGTRRPQDGQVPADRPPPPLGRPDTPGASRPAGGRAARGRLDLAGHRPRLHHRDRNGTRAAQRPPALRAARRPPAHRRPSTTPCPSTPSSPTRQRPPPESPRRVSSSTRTPFASWTGTRSSPSLVPT
jgi:integrase